MNSVFNKTFAEVDDECEFEIGQTQVCERLRFEDFLDAQADHIFRIKGIVDLRTDEGLVPTLVQAVGDRVELDPIAKTSPLYAIPRRLIFIGNTHALDPIRLSRALHGAAHESLGK